MPIWVLHGKGMKTPFRSPHWPAAAHSMFSSLVVWAMVAEAALAGDKHWPQWRGPNAQGVSEAQGLPEQWSSTEHIKWKADLPGVGDSSPCVWGERVFITSSIPEGGDIKPGDPVHPTPTGPMAQFR